MRIDVPHRLATIATLVTLGVTGLAATPGQLSDPDPCPNASLVFDEEFMVFVDRPGAPPARVPVWSEVACPVSRTVFYETYDITALAGADYVGATPGAFTFPGGATGAAVTIHIIGDAVREPDETFGVRLISGARFGSLERQVTISDG